MSRTPSRGPGDEGPAGSDRFDEIFARADAIPGWLTRDQARRLYDEACALPRGARIVEIGSHQGRSTVVLASARDDVEVVAIDPFVGGKFGGELTRRRFEHHLREHDLDGRVRLLVDRSERVRSSWNEPVELIYVDGKHDARSTSQDLQWAALLPYGGRVLVHDCFSSIGVTLALLFRVLPGRELRYLGRVGSLATFERTRPRLADRSRILRELPWWLRNVGIKVLLRLRLNPIARAVGHHDTFDPY
jgi:predicted O-methyltransferase YrrM